MDTIDKQVISALFKSVSIEVVAVYRSIVSVSTEGLQYTGL